MKTIEESEKRTLFQQICNEIMEEVNPTLQENEFTISMLIESTGMDYEIIRSWIRKKIRLGEIIKTDKTIAKGASVYRYVKSE